MISSNSASCCRAMNARFQCYCYCWLQLSSSKVFENYWGTPGGWPSQPPPPQTGRRVWWLVRCRTGIRWSSHLHTSVEKSLQITNQDVWKTSAPSASQFSCSFSMWITRDFSPSHVSMWPPFSQPASSKDAKPRRKQSRCSGTMAAASSPVRWKCWGSKHMSSCGQLWLMLMVNLLLIFMISSHRNLQNGNGPSPHLKLGSSEWPTSNVMTAGRDQQCMVGIYRCLLMVKSSQ